MLTVGITTFGCKLNQAESAQITEFLQTQGYRVVTADEPADFYVINTCAVTARAEARGRQAIRKIQRFAPEAVIIITGCYAEVGAASLKNIPGVDYILGSDYKFQLLPWLAAPVKNTAPVIQTRGIQGHPCFENIAPGTFLEHTRAFLKIQDGCHAFCSYCIVPYARGENRSGTPAEILTQARQLVARGYQEIVLTGAHLGLYGQDQTPPVDLTQLLAQLLQIEGLARIRLSSLEPLEVTDDLLHLISHEPRVCPHLHIPLQSGDDAILNAMNRHYSAAQFKALILKISARIPHLRLGTDVMVGFPGETEAMFENSHRLIAELPFSYLHVFSYSVRPGTAAAKLGNRVSKPIQTWRSNQLIELGRQQESAFLAKFWQQSMPVLFEQAVSPGCYRGLTSNYLRVQVCCGRDLVNQIHWVRLDQCHDDWIAGQLVEAPVGS
ncbi:tRNA (N(6)-L-threonylcarbamoyladenosine(37)-C(2))-methylthiotransferase MtaB [candidate division KSB1 bacterium]|nr:tRNA (N(6)-L-threonylcarbamoyladenosine(37)-C(2))-methylthiotransferase MtaB [candidate division KSB1 bacterium]